MLKVLTELDGKPTVILGLDWENLARLREDMPVPVSLAEFGLPDIQVLIMAGRSQQTMLDDLRAAGLRFLPPPEPT